jgi:2-hydroxychromene-2-carboxylate isomerase
MLHGAVMANDVAFEPGRTLPARALELWFDYTCPFAYLGSLQADALAARMGVRLAWQPMLLGGVFKARSTPQKLFETLGPAKAAHNAHDMDRWAARLGVPLRMPTNHPMRSVDALRATLAAGIDPKVIAGFYRAYWVDGVDIADRAVLARVLRAAGHDADAVLAEAASDRVKDDLRARTDRAIAKGIFGVPTWIVDDDHLYWGQDRLAFVEGKGRAGPGAPGTDEPVVPRSPPRTLEVFWDFASPFAYLGVTQLAALAARTGATVVEKPILVGGLFKAIGTAPVPLATFSPEKQAHVAKDLDRWAAYWGVPFQFTSCFPVSSVLALRVWLALPAQARAAFRDRTFRAAWADDEDIADPAVLARCVGDASLAGAALAAASTEAVKAELRRNTDEAAGRGIFGVPSFVVDGGAPYFGQDRLAMVEDALSRP